MNIEEIKKAIKFCEGETPENIVNILTSNKILTNEEKSLVFTWAVPQLMEDRELPGLIKNIRELQGNKSGFMKCNLKE